MRVLANDGIPEDIKHNLETFGFEVKEVRVAHEQLVAYTQKNEIDILLIQQGTLLTKRMIDELNHLKAIVFAGVTVNLESIDHIKSNGISVIWAEEALANATAEMVLAHLFSGARLLQEANRNMPLEGDTMFKSLQQSYSSGVELSGKTLGIIGMNLAGQLLAQKALGLGMHVVYSDSATPKVKAAFELPNGLVFPIDLEAIPLSELAAQAHFISIHTKYFQRYVVNKDTFEQAVNLIGIVNCAYPEAINEVDLVDEVNKETILFAGLDRFEEEPHPAIQVLMQPAFSLSPNIGTATHESQHDIWSEIQNKMRELLN
ncbi:MULTISPECIES: NAD(P)-dependent oxidoreductase [unclassified Myroides]|uniref:NAD(P)-dependent oxidoreductase n=1 Tax=unclassified Myroides TaxID=2642485 RepID=UPI0015FC5D07|nr:MULTISPECIES: NAD(P)-dependent oxidoreductase [unclassified Myroides]MBB1150150.1 3-phosphoglycerate dehydrogenase [Myroides sp. NP-2]MDM1408383.1 3-phosphoglycerate dehydrogenase [Myroides sp. DF42-4-2]